MKPSDVLALSGEDSVRSDELGVATVVTRVDRDTCVEAAGSFAMYALHVNRRPGEERRMP